MLLTDTIDHFEVENEKLRHRLGNAGGDGPPGRGKGAEFDEECAQFSFIYAVLKTMTDDSQIQEE